MTNKQIQTDINAAIYYLDEACSALVGIEGCNSVIQEIVDTLKLLEDKYDEYEE